jgi:acyl-coenzyme A thioesterase PaaI-like protein
MTGARSAMQRVFDERQRNTLDDGQMAALTVLATSVRALTETIVLTEVAVDELAAVVREVDALTRRLAVATRTAPPVTQIDSAKIVVQPASPVTGALNPIAPPIEIVVSADGTSRAEFTLSVVYEGPPGFVHGGVSAMILDHLSGSAAAANGTPGMTAGLDMRYRRPTPHSVPLSAEAKALRVDGRKTFVESRIIGPDGVVTTEATAVFIMPTL